jgi:UDPglucose 6-dehydrogenase
VDICVVGTGYVGLVAGPCLADLGHHVVCVDKDESKIAQLLEGVIPIYEPGLEEVVERAVKVGRLRFTTDLAGAVAASEVVFVAVGTPPAADGSADLSGVFAVAEAVAGAMARRTTIVIKSTVPVGTADAVRRRVTERAKHPFDVVSNPEFLAEGTALDDFMKPDRIVVGYKDGASASVMDRIYAPLVRTGRPILHMDNRSAEMSKYASNAMLATRITFMNDVANLCDAVGADVEMVRRVVAGDTRIGARYLFPGAGYGGSCFPKDVQAFVQTGVSAGYLPEIAETVHRVNERQKAVLAKKLAAVLGDDWKGKHVAVWGLAFKARTDDIREAPSLVFVEEALKRGATVTVYDPEAMGPTKKILGDRVAYAADPISALDGADALVIPTDWNEFRSPDFAEMAGRMKGRVIVDGRNLYDPAEVAKAGFVYRCIGRPPADPQAA